MAVDFKIANYYGLNYKIFSDGTIVGPERGIVKQRENDDGYMEVTLGTAKNRHSRVKVHRVIAEQFVPNPLGLPEVIILTITGKIITQIIWNGQHIRKMYAIQQRLVITRISLVKTIEGQK